MRAFTIVLLALLIAAAWWSLRGAPPPPLSVAPPEPVSAHATTASGGALLREDATDTGAAAPASAAPAAAPGPPAGPGTVVRGEVVDDRGAVVEGVTVSIANIDTAQPSAAILLQAETDTRGRFTIAGAGPGSWYVSVSGLGQLDSRTTKIPEGATEHFLRVTVARPDPATAITGVVVDEHGQPLAGAEVSGYGEGFYGAVRTGADGRFAVPRASPRHDDGTPGVRLSARVEGLDQLVPAPDARLRWGQRGVRIVLRRMPGAWLQVLEPGGRPAADYDAFLWHVGYRSSAVLRPLVRVRGSSEGRARLEDLRLGEHHVLVRAPPGRSWSMIGLEQFTVRASPEVPDVVVRAAPLVSLCLQGVDLAGRATSGYQAELVLELAGEACNLRCLAPALADLDEETARRALWLTLAAAAADDDGRVELKAPPGSYWLRARGEDVLPVIERVELPVGGVSRRLELRAGGAIEGRLVPPSAVAALWPPGAETEHAPTVHVDALDGGDPPPAVAVAADGTFAVRAVPPGRCALVLAYYLDTGEVAAPVSVALGGCAVAAGERRALEFDVSGLLPGTVRLRVTLDGLPMRDAQMFLRRIGDGPPVSRRAHADGEGQVEASLPPGRWSVLLALQAVPGPGWNMLPLPQRWQVRTGRVTEVDLAARTRTLRIRLLDEAGAPLAGASVRVDRANGYFRPGGLTTDEAGRFTLTPTPYGPFHLLVRAPDGSEAKVGPFTLPDERDRDEVEVTVGR